MITCFAVQAPFGCEVEYNHVYRYKPPFGTIQLAYQRGTAEFGQASGQGNTLFLKGTWVF
jgi:hypothetical protein